MEIRRVRTNPYDNLVSTRDTIAVMRTLAWRDASSSEVRSIACSLAGGDIDDTIRNIFDWVRRNIRFVDDEVLLTQYGISPGGIEFVTSPIQLLQRRTGDCDDFSTLLASLLIASRLPIGIHFVTIGENDSEFSHVYVVAELPDGRVIPLDASHGPEPGWETSSWKMKIFWQVKPLNRDEVRSWIRSQSDPLTMRPCEV